MSNARPTPVSTLIRASVLALGAAMTIQGCGHYVVGATGAGASGFEAEAKKGKTPKVPQAANPGGGTYYKSISATATGKTLLAALHTLIAGHKELTYDDARTRMFATASASDVGTSPLSRTDCAKRSP